MPSKLSVHIRDYPENIWDAVGRMQPAWSRFLTTTAR